MKKLFYISLVVLVVFLMSISMFPQSSDKGNKLQDQVFSSYISLQKALADDDLSAAKKAFNEIVKNSEGEINDLSVKGAEAKDLKEMRVHFKQISSQIATQKQPEGFGTAYCPMAKSWWIQEKGNIANPYYGKQMLRCGSFKDFKDDTTKNKSH